MVGLVALAVALPALAYSPSRAGRTGYYGAIAVHKSTSAYGVSFDFRRAREAQAAALRQCGDAECEVIATVHNACVALARDGGKLFHAEGATRDEATLKTRRKCPSGQCEIVAWTCTK